MKLLHLDIFQTIASRIVTFLNPQVIHNLEKYFAIKKAFYLSSIEDVSGDYYEFGVFKGSSFTHAIRTTKSLAPFNKEFNSIHFYGYDSFDGFGDLTKDDVHPFYTDLNFKTDKVKVYNRVKKLINEDRFTLVEGLFEETLTERCPSSVRIAFIDSDTYSSSAHAFRFIKSHILEGTILIIDDFYSYRGSEKKGVSKAFNEFVISESLKVRKVADYGMGGVIFIISELNVHNV